MPIYNHNSPNRSDPNWIILYIRMINVSRDNLGEVWINFSILTGIIFTFDTTESELTHRAFTCWIELFDNSSILEVLLRISRINELLLRRHSISGLIFDSSKAFDCGRINIETLCGRVQRGTNKETIGPAFAKLWVRA